MTDNEIGTCCLIFIVVGWAIMLRQNRMRRFTGTDLDRCLFHWTRYDPFTVRDLLNGGLLIMGITGGGKSSSSGKHIARSLVRDRNTFGLILAAKPEDLPMWQQIFAERRQSHRLLVFDAEQSPLRFNFLEEAGRYGGDTRELVKCISTIGETLQNGNQGRGGENAAFFSQQQERLLYHAVEIVKTAFEHVTSSALHQFISTAAQHGQQLADPAWREGFHSKCGLSGLRNFRQHLQCRGPQQ